MDKDDVIIIGGGLAGIVTAIELLNKNKKIILIDRDIEENLGGQAKESFGGIFMVNSPIQKRMGIKDTTDLAFNDWCNFADFSEADYWPKQWARKYINESGGDLFNYFKKSSIKFFPVVHWVERGMYHPGNSVPRFHMVWGTGKELIDQHVNILLNHKNKQNLKIYFSHHVQELIEEKNKISSCRGTNTNSNIKFEFHADDVVLACGGVGANLDIVKRNWNTDCFTAPDNLLIGCHKYADGELHQTAQKLGANITHLNKMWNYAAGIQHLTKPAPHGLSLVPTKSALWINASGKRIGPMPLVTSYDTRFLVSEICKQEKQYSWQIMNKKIALKELAVSGSEFNDAIRDKKIISFLKSLLFGNKNLYESLKYKSDDFIIASSLEELVEKMNSLTDSEDVKIENLRNDILDYDSQIDRGEKYFNDEQLRRIAHLRQYRGDRIRTCKFQKILDKDAFPLIAIRLKILVRKSLGGIQTDLDSRVLNSNNSPITGLYAVGEAAGFGGGGVHGKRALEGTFLGSCIITAKAAAQAITKEI